jgi:hypothetical protein
MLRNLIALIPCINFYGQLAYLRGLVSLAVALPLILIANLLNIVV